MACINKTGIIDLSIILVFLLEIKRIFFENVNLRIIINQSR